MIGKKDATSIYKLAPLKPFTSWATIIFKTCGILKINAPAIIPRLIAFDIVCRRQSISKKLKFWKYSSKHVSVNIKNLKSVGNFFAAYTFTIVVNTIARIRNIYIFCENFKKNNC